MIRFLGTLSFALLCVASPARAGEAPAGARSTAAVGDTASSRDGRGRGMFRVFIPVTDWSDAAGLTAAPGAFTPPFDGRIRSRGFGTGMSYHHRLGRAARTGLYLGGDLVAFINSSAKRYAGTIYGSGVPVEASIWANSGYFGPSLRYVLERNGRPFLHAGLGGGLYLVRIKDNIGGMIVETGHTDKAPGAFVSLGGWLVPFRRRYAVDLEAKIHTFRFDGLDTAFPGQAAGGPLWELGLGVTRR